MFKPVTFLVAISCNFEKTICNKCPVFKKNSEKMNLKKKYSQIRHNLPTIQKGSKIFYFHILKMKKID